MPKVALYNRQGEEIGEVALSDEIFDVCVSKASVHKVVKMHLANRRQGTSAVKNRSAVRGGGRKPWRQKGTGRARHGTIRSPLWVGGGVVFGPVPRDFSYTIPKKIRRLALKSALTSKVRDGELLVIDELNFSTPKTKEMVNIFKNLQTGKKVLLVTIAKDNNVIKSARNIPGVKSIPPDLLNVYDILNCRSLLLTREALTKVEEVFA